ncbi:MAG: ROK family protein [Methanomicrobiales archaeon]|nr:ROK family protein [Methanomicrobiales archaeon]
MAPVIAVDLGGTWTRVGVVLGDGQILAERSVPTPQEGRGPGVITERVASLVRDLFGSFCPRPEAIGISAAGPVDIRRGALRNPPNLPFSDIPLVEPLSAEFDLPVILANDCHAGIIGEAVFGDAQDTENAVYLTLSTGIGAGVLEGGRLLFGRDGNAAEVGHFAVDTTYRVRCGCGHEGHWEGYASGRHLPQFFARWCEVHGRPLPKGWKGEPGGIFARARQGNPDATAFIDELARINGRGISDLIVAYDPERIILDGAVVRENGDLIYPRCLPFIDRFLPLPELLVSQLNGRAPLLGAAILALGEPEIPGTEVFRAFSELPRSQ